MRPRPPSARTQRFSHLAATHPLCCALVASPPRPEQPKICFQQKGEGEGGQGGVGYKPKNRCKQNSNNSEQNTGCKRLVYKTGERWLHFLRGSAASAGKSWMGFILWQTSGLKVKTYLLPRSCGNYKSLYLIGHRLGLLHGQEIYINTCWSKITRHTLTDTQPVCTIPL